MSSRSEYFWQEAERAAMDYMRRIGFADASLSDAGADGGLDVVASNAAAQVKAHAKSVGSPDLQRLVGASLRTEHRLFFSLSGYSANAERYADKEGVSLFEFGYELSPRPVNMHAKQLVLREPSLSAVQHEFDNDLPAEDFVGSWERLPATAPEQQPSIPHRSTRTARLVESPSPRRSSTKIGLLAKAFLIIFVIGLAVIVSPLLYIFGRIAMRRHEDQLAFVAGSRATRRYGVTVVGAVGTLLLASVAIQNLWWANFGGEPVDGSPGLGALVGAFLGALALAALEWSVRSGRLDRLSVPEPLAEECEPSWSPPSVPPPPPQGGPQA